MKEQGRTGNKRNMRNKKAPTKNHKNLMNEKYSRLAAKAPKKEPRMKKGQQVFAKAQGGGSMITMKHGKTNKAGMTKKNTDAWTQIHGTQIHGTQIHGKDGIPKSKGTTLGSMRQPVGTTTHGINNCKPLKQDQEGRCDLKKTKKEN